MNSSEKNPIQDKVSFTLNNETLKLFKSIANWTLFLSTVGFLGVFLLIILGAFFGVILSNLPINPYENVGVKINYYGLIYILIALIYFFPVWFLFSFAKKIKSAARHNNLSLMHKAFRKLKMHYKYLGILTIIMLCFYFFGFVIGSLSDYF